jgi:hypothetical protein
MESELMALQKCHECHREVSSEAKTCPSCGAKVRKKTSVLVWIIVGLVGFGVLSSMFAGTSDPPKVATTSPPPARTSVPVPAQKVPLDAGSAIAEGEALLKRSKALDTWSKASLAGKSASIPAGGLITKVEWANAGEHLGAIEKGRPEYAQAQALLSVMAAKDKKDAEFVAVEAAKAKIASRKQFAAHLEQSFIESRMNADVTAQGPQNTTLRIKYVLASKVSANDLSKSGVIEKAETAGFKLVQFTDGYNSTWSWKLKQ